MPEPLVEGFLQIADERRDGDLRDPSHPLRPVRPGGVYVPRKMWVDRGLRPGLLVQGEVRGKQLFRITRVENVPFPEWTPPTAIYDATALDPAPQIKLEHNPAELTTRMIDLLTPIGFGQRGLIVAPPRVGKTILLQNMARGIAANHPEADLWLLLVDERPEEVTDMKRNVPGTVYASSNDNTIDKHLDMAKLIIERGKRRAEAGHDVIILLDSLTRLGRAFNTESRSGKTLSGGVDSKALEIPKRLFGAARRLEDAGSLTIMATCLIDTGSQMDKVIFEEFKGTGNMELTLDRKLANNRIFPAINIPQSGTRKEELLLDPVTLAAAQKIRRHLVAMDPAASLKSLIDTMTKVKTNAELVNAIRV
ncbi:MAG TPA: transcription termination factor Rho [Tepidisphaeraceae bacterium]|jgi:transcription termination factor Rho